MASSKNVRKSAFDASSTGDYAGPVTRSRSKALDRLQPQPTKEGELSTVISLDFLAKRKATNKDSSVSKDLENSNESSQTRTFSINSSPVMRNLRNKVPFSSFSPSSLEVMPVMMTNTSTMEEKTAEMEQRIILLTKSLEENDIKIATLMNKLEVEDSGESSHGLERPPGFTLKGENAKGDKGKGENSFKMPQPRPFTRSLIAKFRMKMRMLAMVVQTRLCHSWRNSNLELMKLNPCNPPSHQEKHSPKLLESQRYTLLLPTRSNKPKNVTRALQT
nr:hypothetical protein CFP56_26482 [Quercus suber]